MLRARSIQSFLPVFNGFYSTVFEPDEESTIESPYKYDDYEFDYSEYNQRVSKACVNQIERKLAELGFNIQIVFEALISPREYNFANDSINVLYKLKPSDVKGINDYLKANVNEFDAYITERYTSRSGFMSWYSNDFQDWFKEYLTNKDKLAHVFGAVLEFIFANENYTAFDLYEDICSDCYLDGWLKEGVGGVAERIETYANDNYTTKDIDSIVTELYNEFENEDLTNEYDWLTYNYIKELVNGVFNNIDRNTLNLFA